MEKLYYSIAEVAEMFGMERSHLRYWEKEFEELSPLRKNRIRYYTQEDIQIIKQISFLVNEQKLTLDGAKKKLNSKKDQVAKQQEIAERLKRVKKELQGIARFLMEE